MAAAVIVAAMSCSDGNRSVFVNPSARQGFGAQQAQVGRPVHVGMSGFAVAGTDVVRFTAVDVLGVPPGLVVQDVRAVPIQPGVGIVGLYEGDLAKYRHPVPVQPITSASFTPGQPEAWYVLVTVVAERPGTFETTGIAVSWETDGRSGTQTFDYRIKVNVAR